MYIEKVSNRNSPPAVLLRESYREGDQVKKRTLANLSKLPDDIIEAHDQHITVNSTPGLGTSFTFTLKRFVKQD